MRTTVASVVMAFLLLGGQSRGAEPEAAQSLLVQGGGLFSLGRYAEALEPLHAAIKADPGLVQAHRLLGESLAALGRCEEALPFLEHALQEAPPTHSDNQRTMEALVRCHRQLKAAAAAALAAPPPSEEDEHGADLADRALGPALAKGDRLHWYGTAAGATGLLLVVIGAAIVEDYSDYRRDATNDRCVKPDGNLIEGGCPDNAWSYGLWGAGGLLVIAGGVLLLLHDWDTPGGAPDPLSKASPDDQAPVTLRINLGADRGYFGLAGEF